MSKNDQGGIIDAKLGIDGGLSLYFDGQLMDEGEWWVQNDMLCVEFPNPELGEVCLYVVSDKEEIQLYGTDGILNEVYTYHSETTPEQ